MLLGYLVKKNKAMKVAFPSSSPWGGPSKHLTARPTLSLRLFRQLTGVFTLFRIFSNSSSPVPEVRPKEVVLFA